MCAVVEAQARAMKNSNEKEGRRRPVRRNAVHRPTNDNINNRSSNNNNNYYYYYYYSFPTTGRQIYSDVYPAVARRVARELGVFALVSRVQRVFRVLRFFVFVLPG